MATLDDKNKQKKVFAFSCISCDYNTSRKSNYETHLLTDKHQRLTKYLQTTSKSVKKQQEQAETFNCSCGKQYQHRQSLWKHKKSCMNDATKQQELINYLLKENSEFKQLMMDQNNKIMELTNSILKSI